MLGRPPMDAKGKQGIANVEAKHNILKTDSFDQTEAFQFESKFDGTVLTSKDHETDGTSKRTFFLIANNIPDSQLGQVRSTLGEKSESSLGSTFEKPESVKLDSIRSGESLIKHFNFDTSKYNSVTNKCIAFWRTLMKTDLKPVKCTLLKGDRNSIESKECDPEEEEESVHQNNNNMWYKALIELQRRKMDEAAFAASNRRCKLCDQDEPYSKFKKKQGGKYSDSELRDSEDLKCLNYWNPSNKQIVSSKASSNIQKPAIMKDLTSEAGNHEIVSLPAVPDTLTVEDKSVSETILIHDYSSASEVRTSVNENQHVAEKCEPMEIHSTRMVHSDSDLCQCGRARCLCTEDDGTSIHEQYSIKLSISEPCECGRAQCVCSPCHEQETHSTHWSLFDTQEKDALLSETEEENDKISTNEKDTKEKEATLDDEGIGDETGDKSDAEDTSNEEFPKGILPKCDICKVHCQHWEHKIQMSKQFINDLKNQSNYTQTSQDAACGTEQEIGEEKVVPQQHFCVICGHNDCNCDGPKHKQPRKYIEYIEFDDNIISTLTIKKDKSLKKIMSMTKAEKISKSALQKRICEHSKEHICTLEQANKESNDQKEKIETSETISISKTVERKLFITPEERAKNITNSNKIFLKLDKYGIPQVVRHADGHLAPKPATSQDISCSSNSDN